MCDISVMEGTHPLRVWRTSAGKTLAELGEIVGTSPSNLSEIERYENTPSLTLAAKLSQESGIPIDSFVKQAEAAE